jgi:hypothetical protein
VSSEGLNPSFSSLSLSLSPEIFALFSPASASRVPGKLFPRFFFLNRGGLKRVLNDESNSPGSRRPKAMQSNKDHSVYLDFFSYVTVSFCLSAEQKATSCLSSELLNKQQLVVFMQLKALTLEAGAASLVHTRAMLSLRPHTLPHFRSCICAGSESNMSTPAV